MSWFAEWSSASLVRGHLFAVTWGIADCLLLPSVALMPAGNEGRYTWGSLSFISLLHLLQAWLWMFFALRLNLQNMKWQVVNIAGAAAILVLFGSAAMMALENLEDPPELVSVRDGDWTFVSSVYFVAISVATVGYGDLAPTTIVGRVAAVAAVIGGLFVLASALHGISRMMVLQSLGGGSFKAGVRTKLVIVSGSPSAAMCKDFLVEIFHEDHAEDAEDLHVVFLFPKGGPSMDEVKRHLDKKENVSIAVRVTVLLGSVLDVDHLQRVSAAKAQAFFILPNMQSNDSEQEDAENIIRMMAIKQFLPSARIVLLLLKADSRYTLEDSGVGRQGAEGEEITIIAVDQFKMELVGKNLDAHGFAPFICNLCKSVGEDAVPDDEAGDTPEWIKEYLQGVGNELYEIELSGLYADKRQATFSEVALDVLEQTGGYAYLIGLVEYNAREHKRRVLVNPGPQYRIRGTTSPIRTCGIFIAADREAVVQCEVNMVFLGRRERPLGDKGNHRVQAAGPAAPLAPSPAEKALGRVAGPALAERAKQVVRHAKVHSHGLRPARPPLKMLAEGGHILVLCVGATDLDDLRLGALHFVRPLRQNKSLKELRPIVVMSPLVPCDWDGVCDQQMVYYMRGLPLRKSDLERVNFRAAFSVFVCNVSSAGGAGAALDERWKVDAEAISCARLLEVQLPRDTAVLVVVDLKDGPNHRYLPEPCNSTPDLGTLNAHLRMQSSRSLEDEPSVAANKDSSRPSILARARMVTQRIRLATALVEPDAQEQAHGDGGEDADDYFAQPRFASGQLYVGTIVTSLVVNTFYNPSLSDLVSAMIAADIYKALVPQPFVGKSYFEFFDHLLWAEQRLAVGILRRSRKPEQTGEGDPAKPKPGDGFAFMYTAPPAKMTTLLETDIVICFEMDRALRFAPTLAGG
uniref:Potassium channel domain-containing protein n=1 Tax=Zooxanthella nutricula TaxID=1333877 RepID=A0A7S2HRB2_9DINO